MKIRECQGELITKDGDRVTADLQITISRSTRWFQARGFVLLPFEFQIHPESKKFQLGTFFCKKAEHAKDKDIFLLSATDVGSLVKPEHEKSEFRRIEVSLLRVTDERPPDQSSRPRIHHYD